MITLDADKIRDFQTCELLYKYRHVEQRMEPISHRDILLDRFEYELKKILSFFFYKKQGGNTPSLNALLNRWQRSWFDGDTTAYDLAVSQQEPHVVNETNLTTRAAAVLMNFYKDFCDDLSQPVLIDETVMISLDNDIRLSGIYDIALRNPKTNEVLIIKWITRTKGSWGGNKDYALDFAVLDYLFWNKSSLSKVCTPIYAIYELGSKSNRFKTITVEDHHKKALSFWAKRVSETEVYAPVRGLSVACKTCPFDDPCKTYDEYSVKMNLHA